MSVVAPEEGSTRVWKACVPAAFPAIADEGTIRTQKAAAFTSNQRVQETPWRTLTSPRRSSEATEKATNRASTRLLCRSPRRFARGGHGKFAQELRELVDDLGINTSLRPPNNRKRPCLAAA